MALSDVLENASRLEAAGVGFWIDGGWGVDALLGRQTREHDDLDLVIDIAQSDSAKRGLSAGGFSLGEDEFPTRFVMADMSGRKIDFHPVTFQDDGSGIQQLQQSGSFYRYPSEGFGATGRLGGRRLRCISAKVQMECHLGYEPDEKDVHDVKLLHRELGVPLPREYRALVK